MARGKDGLYRRRNHKTGILHFQYLDVDGQWKEKSSGMTDREAAKKFMEEYKDQLKKGELPTEKAAQTVEQACCTWVEQHKARLTSAKAQKNEQYYLGQVTRRLGSRKLKSITLDDLKNYQATRKVKARPINIELAILVNVLKEANLWRGSLKNYKRLPERKSGVGKALSPEQRQLLETTAGTKDAWQVAYWAQMLAINTGMRGGEVKKLRLRNVDLENRRVTVEQAKTDAGNRLVPLNSVAMSALAKLRCRAEELGACDPDHYLLPADLSAHTKKTDPLRGKKGFDITRHQLSWDTAWRNLRKAAVASITGKAAKENRELTFAEREDIKVMGAVGFHSMRHTFITMMAERNVPLPVTMSMVGHMSAEMTKHYTHISDKAQRQAVELLDQPAPSVQQQVVQEEKVYRA
jgi:integrase